MNLRSATRALALGVVALLAVAGCAANDGATAGGGDTGGDASMTLSVGRVGISPDASIQLAKDNGIYASHGLTVNDTVAPNPPAALASVQSGQMDVAYTTLSGFFTALSQGIPLQIIAPADGVMIDDAPNANPFRLDNTGLIVRPDSGVASPADLEGKTVAVLARQAQAEITTAWTIQQAGGDPSKVNWVTLDFASAVEALKSGTIDGATLVSPFTNQAVDEGMTQLAAPAYEFFGQGATIAVWVSTPDTIAAKGDAIDAFIDAQREAAEFANANLDDAMAAAKQITGTTLPVEQMTPVYWVPEIDRPRIEEQAAQVHELGYLAQPLDLSNAFYAP